MQLPSRNRRKSFGIGLRKELKILAEVQKNSRASRSARLHGAIVQDAQRSFAQLRRQIGARRIVNLNTILQHRLSARIVNAK